MTVSGLLVGMHVMFQFGLPESKNPAYAGFCQNMSDGE